ncbi:Uncharacterized protein BP5553_05474 [Venustampulla echinocandica]|uniref:Extracellular membrane protein CFEM domain-containing protein n=1 Tax=Venustampulla echinocandica TaxID=2656787 RepID=A0A370TR97_9HELO|nr:Uncharacterized protein BP5553_05474 [Venustampulla echinocandica]RDL38041.1 Uncharacterized protein BP5553_05474 [Venustampulla echinocandica]
MYASSTFVLGAIMALARVAIATPPACLLAALGAQSNPADLKSLCGTLVPQLSGNITEKCSGDARSAAISAYSATCLSSESVTITISSSSSSKTGSATATTTGSGSAIAKPTGSATSGSGSGNAAGTATGTGAAPSGTGSSGAGSTSPQFAMYMAPVVLAAGFAGQYVL